MEWIAYGKTPCSSPKMPPSKIYTLKEINFVDGNFFHSRNLTQHENKNFIDNKLKQINEIKGKDVNVWAT